MKKLMMAVAIVCATVAAEAATYNWNFNSQDAVYDGYNASTVGGSSANAVGSGLMAYLISYDSTSMNQGTILTGLRDGKDIDDIAGKSLLATSTTGSDSKITSAKWSDTTGSSINAFEVIVSDDGKYAYLSGNASYTATQDPGETAISWSTGTTKKLRDKDGTASFGSAGWYNVESVPEPTSGLLLLLGMAGLALRRRRA